MAPEQAEGKRDRPPLRPLQPRRSCSTRRSRACTRSARARRPPPPSASGPCSRRSSASARTCRPSCAPRSTAPCGPSPPSAARSRSWPTRSRTRSRRCPTRAARSRSRSRAPPIALPRGVARGLAAAAAGGLCAVALAWAGQPVAAGARRRRRRRAAAAARLAGHRGGDGRRAVGRATRAPRCSSASRSRRSRCCCAVTALTWSVPALAPLLGLATIAGAYPALAGRAHGWFTRAALGALGAWWALLAAPLLGRRDLLGDGDRRRWPTRARASTRPSTSCCARCSRAASCSTSRCGPSPPRSCRGSSAAGGSRSISSAACAWAAALGAATVGDCRRDRRRRAAPHDRSPASSRGCSRSRSPTSGGLRWWSRDAWPDTVHRQSWPSHPRSGA